MLGQSFANQVRFWPGYIDNSGCYYQTECGQMVNIFKDDGKIFVGGRKRPILTNTQEAWRNGNGPNSTHSIKPLLHVEMRGIAGRQSDEGKYGVYLKDGAGVDTEYRLKGFPSGKDFALNVRAWLCNVEKGTNKCNDNGKFVDYKFTLSELMKGSYSKNEHLLNNLQAISWLEVWVYGNNYRLASDDAFKTRSLQLPGLWLYIQTKRYNQYGDEIPYNNSGSQVILISEKIARLNHRQCNLTITPNKPVHFGNLSVTDDEEGQIGTTIDTRVELSCPGTYTEGLISGGFSSEDKPDPSVNVWTPTQVSGQNAVHVVEEMKISATSPVMINGEKKIGLVFQKANTLDGSAQLVPNPNIYVEGSLTKTPFCGKQNNPLPLDVDLKQHSMVQSFQNTGEKDHAIGPKYVNTFYWKLCKKNGEVEGGKYKGTATISIKYK